MSTKESANGWPACMVQAHIEDTTAACARRRYRKAERRAWLTLALFVAGVAACVAWSALR
ncbi:MAG TPA: hypothetical protein VGE09_11115 [Pseudoxanthomonas sp.]